MGDIIVLFVVVKNNNFVVFEFFDVFGVDINFMVSVVEGVLLFCVLFM